jgi:hypothetical protein
MRTDDFNQGRWFCIGGLAVLELAVRVLWGTATPENAGPAEPPD